MGLLDYVSQPSQRVAYLFPEFDSVGQNRVSAQRTNGGISINPLAALRDVFVFQFWPQQVSDNYTPNYATKQIPGASHPLYQWVSGSGRTISFTATFISEIREDAFVLQGNAGIGNDFRSRLNTAGSVSNKVGNAVGAALLPSTRYKVNVAAALAALQQYLYPTYDAVRGITKPPKKLILVLPGTKLGRSDSADGILCIMKAANVTMESWFPSGELRSASVALEFAEIVQYTQGEGTNIRYIGAESYTDLARKYEISNVGAAADLAF